MRLAEHVTRASRLDSRDVCLVGEEQDVLHPDIVRSDARVYGLKPTGMRETATPPFPMAASSTIKFADMPNTCCNSLIIN